MRLLNGIYSLFCESKRIAFRHTSGPPGDTGEAFAGSGPGGPGGPPSALASPPSFSIDAEFDPPKSMFVLPGIPSSDGAIMRKSYKFTMCRIFKTISLFLGYNLASGYKE